MLLGDDIRFYYKDEACFATNKRSLDAQDCHTMDSCYRCAYLGSKCAWNNATR